MKCPTCGSAMTAKRESFRYKASGLPGLTLVGVKVSRCRSCGEYEVAIPAIEDLHRAIARALVEQPGRLDHNEIRFLRKHLGLSGADFGRLIDAAPETVSRWERGAQRMSLMAERLLRLMVVTRQPEARYALERLADVEGEVRRAGPLRLKRTSGAWRPAAAA